tara:strand:- start:212 stop:397 length:186 start_codon:yes stop_codon:yes gene_type:complete
MNNKEVTKIYERLDRLRIALTGIKRIIEVALNENESESSSGHTAKYEDTYIQKHERPSNEK